MDPFLCNTFRPVVIFGCSIVLRNVWACIDAPCLGADVCVFFYYVTVMMWHWQAGVQGPQSNPPSLSPSMLNVPGHRKLPRTSGSQGLLGSGISCWEETAEACVASALANQHSHHTHMHARRPNLCSPSIIPSSFFRRGQTPTKARWAHKSQRGPMGESEGRRGGDKGTLKCLVKADRAAESSLMLAQTDNSLKFWVKLMSCQFVFNMSVFGKCLGCKELSM